MITRLNAVVSMGARSVSKEETQKTLDFLGEYIDRHFTDEEALQKQSEYPKYEWHKGQHKIYIDEFQKLKKEFMANGVSAKFTLDLSNSMVNWIVRHIKTVDVEFGKHCKARTHTGLKHTKNTAQGGKVLCAVFLSVERAVTKRKDEK